MSETQDHINRLFSFTAEFAQEMLKANGEFYPFGATVTKDGEVAAVGGDAGGDDHPLPQEVYRTIAEGLALAAARDGILAAALVAHVSVPVELEAPSESGIRVHLEAPGFARFVYVPYEAQRDGDTFRVHLHEPLAVEVEPGFFV